MLTTHTASPSSIKKSVSEREVYYTEEGVTVELEDDQEDDIIGNFGYSGGKSVGELSGRPQWGNNLQFLMVLMGYAIGISNVWRFPYLCAKFGGGSFLLAYLICLLTCAFPLFFYEMILGQYFQKGPVDVFKKLYYRFRGLAYIAAAMSFILLTYYQVAICWALVYFWYSLSGIGELPWSSRANPDMNSETFFYQEVLNRSERTLDGGFADDNPLCGKLVASLLVVWLITYACLFRGIHSAGKIAIVMVIFPFVLMLILLVRCAFLEGAGTGVAYYITPRLEILATFDLWIAACGQILFSLSPGTGAAISLSSFNPRFHHGLLKDAILIAFFNSLFSIIGGFVVFSVIGHLSLLRGVPVDQVATSGPGLAFILFADAFTQIEGGRILSTLFFLMLLLLGLDSSFAWVQTLQTYILDAILTRRPDLNCAEGIPKIYTKTTLSGLCFVLFLMGLPYTTRRGSYYLEGIDHFCPTYCLLITAFFEYILLGWIVGGEELWTMFSSMRGKNAPLRAWLKTACLVQVRYIGPGLLVFLFIATIAAEGRFSASLQANPDGYFVFHGYPSGLIACGWLTVLIPVWIFIYYMVKADLKRIVFVKIMPRIHDLFGRTGPALKSAPGGGAGYPHFAPEMIGRSVSYDLETNGDDRIQEMRSNPTHADGRIKERAGARSPTLVTADYLKRKESDDSWNAHEHGAKPNNEPKATLRKSRSSSRCSASSMS